MINKLCLGTAKIGMPDYGYSSTDILKNVDGFLLQSFSLGISNLDTSPRYGNSEEIVGNILRVIENKPNISTKVDKLTPNSKQNPSLMQRSIERSIKRLNIEIVDICYLHQNEIEIISDKYVHKGIEILKERRLIREIGTSVYSKSELQYTLDSGIFDWVQIPVNVLDTSYYNMVSKYDTNIKVSARSVFLQGILFNSHSIRDDIKDHTELLNTLELIDRLCSKYDVKFHQLSLAYLNQLESINQIILGTTSIDNLADHIVSAKLKLPNELLSSLETISKHPKTWTNPRYWNVL